jgi:hypothetical protein
MYQPIVYRKALGIAGLSVLMVLVFAGAALAMPAEAAPPSSVDDKHQALVSRPQVREGPPSYWTTVSAAVGGQDRAEIQHLGDAEPATVAGVFGDRAETGLGPIGGQERADIQHVGEAPQPSTNLEPSSGGIDLEVVLLTGTLALIAVLMTAGAFLWFRRHTVRPA